MQSAPTPAARKSGGCHERKSPEAQLRELSAATEPEPGDRQVDPHREGELFPLEPLRERRRGRDDQRLGAETEDEAAGHHPRELRREGDEQPAEAAIHDPEQEESALRPGPVDEDAAEQENEERRDVVGRIEKADLRLREAELLLEEGADRVQARRRRSSSRTSRG